MSNPKPTSRTEFTPARNSPPAVLGFSQHEQMEDSPADLFSDEFLKGLLGVSPISQPENASEANSNNSNNNNQPLISHSSIDRSNFQYIPPPIKKVVPTKIHLQGAQAFHIFYNPKEVTVCQPSEGTIFLLPLESIQAISGFLLQ